MEKIRYVVLTAVIALFMPLPITAVKQLSTNDELLDLSIPLPKMSMYMSYNAIEIFKYVFSMEIEGYNEDRVIIEINGIRIYFALLLSLFLIMAYFILRNFQNR